MSNQPSLRLGLLALMAWFMLVVSQHPVSVGAVDLPALGHEFEVAVSHMETELPTGPNVHAVEYWNGVVCETPAVVTPTPSNATPEPEQCSFPSAVDEYGQ
ncbi:MAG: hypothetical protein DWI48_03040 [Chloroflexi bacterium]|nr:MAG: hypothetical protein DWI48_03040 [Chloroflexota bacterium]